MTPPGGRGLPPDTDTPWMQSPQEDPPPTGMQTPLGTPPDENPLPPVDRRTPVKTLSCPKLRLRAVINYLEYDQKNIGETYVFTVWSPIK